MDVLRRSRIHPDLAIVLRDLKGAALKDEEGKALDAEIQKYGYLAELG
jgi:hypothetical protein